MASTVAGGLFNAFAFAGASWIMSHVDHSNYQAEQKRHDLAVERMQAAQQAWQKRETELRDKIAIQKLEMENANHDLKDGVDALDQYHKLLKEQDIHHRIRDKSEDFSNFYHPSEEFQNYLTGVKIIIVGGCVYVASKYVF